MKDYWNSLTFFSKLKFVLAIVFLVYGIFFAFLNWQETEINFLFFKVQISMTLLIFICIGIGYFISEIFEYRKFISLKKKEKSSDSE